MSDLLGTEEQVQEEQEQQAEQPQAEQQAAEAQEAEAEQKGDLLEAGKLYADRFKTVEDLEKAYKSLQGEYTRIKNPPQRYEYKGEVIEVDEELNEVLRSASLSREQAERILEAVEKKVKPAIAAKSTEAEELRARAMLGFTPNDPSYKDFIATLRSWAKENVPEPVLDALKGSAEGIVALHRMMKASIDGNSPTNAGSGSGTPTKDEILQRINDPRYAWDANFRRETDEMLNAML